MKWSIEKKMSAGFAVALLLAMVIAPVSYLAMNQLTIATERISRTNKVLTKLSQTLSGMQKIETDSRGFALAGDERFLNLYEPAVTQVGVHVQELQELSAHDPYLQQKLKVLAPLLDRKLSFANALVALRQRKGLLPAAKKLSSDPNRELIDQIRSTVADIQASENLRLSEQEIQAKIGVRRATVLLSALTALIIAQLGCLFHFIMLDRAERKRAEEVLRESDLRFRIVARATNEAVWDWNMAKDSVWWNHGVQTLFGYNEEQVDPTGDWRIRNVHPDDRERVSASVQVRVQGHEDFWSAEYRFRRADGLYADILDRGYILRDHDGKAVRMIGAMQDFTERKQAEEKLRQSEEGFRALLEGVKDYAIFMLDPNGQIVSWNAGAERINGYQAEEIIGKNFCCFYRSEDIERGKPQKVLDQAAAEGRYEEEGWRVRKDGSQFLASAVTTALHDETGGLCGFAKVTRDITERKRMEELARARDAALESARLKSQFLANMSHEIRTPMNSVIGMTGLLLNTSLTNEQREFAEAVRFSGDSLLTLINDILDFSKIEAGKLTFEIVNFNLRETIGEVVLLLADQTQAKKVTLATSFAPDLPAMIRGDPGRLRQVLTNLAGNALKFTRQGEVVIRARQDSETDAHVVIHFEVADTGIGIPEQARDGLFQPFFQVDASTTRRYGGTGLGLAICKQLVQLMGGQIGVQSIPGKGSTFEFTARFEKATAPEGNGNSDPATNDHEAPAVALPTLPEKAHKRGHILIAEDNALNQKVILRQLQEMGHSVDAVASGVEVIEALKQISYDLILMDCQMPEMDGYEATAEIRRREGKTKHTPIIAMTAHVMQEDKDKCLAAGMDDFLSKPVRVARLKKVLTHWLSQPDGSPSDLAGATGQSTRDVPAFAAQPVATRSFSPVDMEIFNEVAGGAQRQHVLAERYLLQAGDQLAKLAAAIDAGTANEVKRVAHSVAGSSAMCGMVDIVPLLRELERMGHENNLIKAAGAYTKVKEEFERITVYLHNQIREELTV